MKRCLFKLASVVLCVMAGSLAWAQTPSTAPQPLYFPPSGGAWEKCSPAEARWDQKALDRALDFAGEQKSSGVVILYRGRILAERYWDLEAAGDASFAQMVRGHDREGRPITDVASIQKSVASVLAGIAQAQGLLRLDDPVSLHLGAGWSKAARDQEARITLRHLMTMTSGLSNDLGYEAEPGSKWHYNEAGFECALKAIAAAAKTTPADLARQWLTSRIGMNDSGWVKRPDGRDVPGGKAIGFATTPRDLARFGLLILADGEWNGQAIVDRAYLRLALRPSQKLNPSYGYFWWLNGQERMINPSDRPKDGPWIPTAPADLVGALGGGERRVYIVPSLELVVTRLGDKISSATFDTDFWKLLSAAAPKPAPAPELPDRR